jgi:septum formation protein
MIPNPLQNKKIILASASPRRQHLLRELGLSFEVRVPDVDETILPGHTPEEIAVMLAERKSDAMASAGLPEDTILITADTIVSIGDEILGKPTDKDDAIRMLGKLSGKKHEVVTAVCLRSANRRITIHVLSSVYFAELTLQEIEYYVENYKPFDKAGSYGIQEWIGYIGIDRIEGSFFNIMGLPVREVYEELLKFCSA